MLKKRTRKEIFEEIIKKSKVQKLQAQREQEENVLLGRELDEKFDDVFKELKLKNPNKKLKTAKGAESSEYEAISRALMFEPKMKATVFINEEKKKERERKKKLVSSEAANP